MKRVPWSETLLAVAVLSVLANAIFCQRYVRVVRLARNLSLQGELLQEASLTANQERAMIQQLAIAALEHARQNPAMLNHLAPFFPMFRDLGINVSSNAVPANEP